MTPLSELRPLIRSTLIDPLHRAMTTHPAQHPEVVIERIPLTMATHGLPVSLCYTEGRWTVSVSVPLEARGPLEAEGRASTLAKALFQVGNAMLQEIEYRECQRRRPRQENGDESPKTLQGEGGDPRLTTPNGYVLVLLQSRRAIILMPAEGAFGWTPPMVEPLLPLIRDKAVLAVSPERLSIRHCDSLTDALLDSLVAAADTALGGGEDRVLRGTWRFNGTNKREAYANMLKRWHRGHHI